MSSNHGFAFSQEAGQDLLVTDNITNRLKDAFVKQIFGNFFEPRQTKSDLAEFVVVETKRARTMLSRAVSQ